MDCWEEAMNTLCIVAARGGSVRVPGKNLRPVLGKPLLWYTFENIRQAGLIDRTIMVTDDNAIAEYSADNGVSVVMEPRRTAETENGIRAIQIAYRASMRHRRECGLIVSPQVTCPLYHPSLFQTVIETVGPDCNAAFSVVKARTPLGYMIRLDGDNRITTLAPSVQTTQQPTYYEYSGCMFACHASMYDRDCENMAAWNDSLNAKAVIHDDPMCDIDSEDDLLWLEHLLQTGRYPWLVP
jgi:CMP-N-acetylneuraminic acid synthetase